MRSGAHLGSACSLSEPQPPSRQGCRDSRSTAPWRHTARGSHRLTSTAVLLQTSILLPGACCFCCEASNSGEIKLNSSQQTGMKSKLRTVETGCQAKPLLADALSTGTHRQSHTHLGVTQQEHQHSICLPRKPT